MVKKLAALEIHYLLKEFQVLIGARIDKIYHLKKKEILLQLYVPRKGKYFLRIDKKSIHLTDRKPKHLTSGEPTDFCMYLRKKLKSGRIRKIKQLRFERIVSLEVGTKDDEFELIVELFSKGNIILTKQKEILSAVEYQKWRSRTIRPRVEYEYPQKEYNFLKLKKKQLKDTLKNTNKENLVKCLAVDLGLGGTYAEEACALSEIDKNKETQKLDKKEVKKLFDSLKKIKEKKLSPRLVYEKEELVDLVPFKLKIYSDLKQKKAEGSYSEILDKYFLKIRKKKRKKQREKEAKRIMKIIEEQKRDIKNLKKQEKINKEKAEKIYENYQKISKLLNELKEISKEHPWKEIKDKLKGHKVIKTVLPKEKSVVIDIK